MRRDEREGGKERKGKEKKRKEKGRSRREGEGEMKGR